MKTCFNFQFNGWKLTMKLNIPKQEILNNLIQVKSGVVGTNFDDVTTYINLETGVIICGKDFIMKPYECGKPIKVSRKFKVPIDTIKLIKVYLQ